MATIGNIVARAKNYLASKVCGIALWYIKRKLKKEWKSIIWKIVWHLAKKAIAKYLLPF